MKPACLFLLLLLSSLAAHAEPVAEDRRTAAETLFVEGRRLMAEGKSEEACLKFAESQRLEPGIGTLLNLARCYARTGRTASAWAAYRDAAGQARATGQAERETAARTEADRLEPTLSRVAVTLTAPAARQKLSVSLDGVPWSSALVGVSTPVDPGAHTIVATGPGLIPGTTRFAVAAGRTLEVELPALRPAPPPRTTAQNKDEPWRWTHTTAVSVAAVGVAAVVTGAVWGLDARSTYDRSRPYCNARDECGPRGLSYREDAFDRARMSTIAFSAGAAALVSAAVLWFTRRAPDRPPWTSQTGKGPGIPGELGVTF